MYQVVEDVALVDVDSDERLEANGVDLAEVSRGLRDKHVQDVEELLVSRLHNLLVIHAVDQRLLRVTRPHELQRQQPHLTTTPTPKLSWNVPLKCCPQSRTEVRPPAHLLTVHAVGQRLLREIAATYFFH